MQTGHRISSSNSFDCLFVKNRLVKDNDPALLQDLAKRTIGTEEVDGIEFCSSPSYYGPRRTIQVHQNEGILSGYDGILAIKRTNLFVGKHGTCGLRGGTTKGQVQYKTKKL